LSEYDQVLLEESNQVSSSVDQKYNLWLTGSRIV
jgi:hypothetical protein